jgi:hypothetical protein
VFRKEPCDVRFAVDERRRCPRGKERVKLALPKHGDERLIRTDRPQIESRDRFERRALMPAGLLLTAAAPMDFGRQHAIFVLDQTAHPYHGRDLIFRHANAFAA